MAEPNDRYVYDFLSIYKDTFEFYLSAIKFYESLLQDNLQSIQSDPDLKALSDFGDERFAIHDELESVRHTREFLEQRKKQDGVHGYGYHVTIPHGAVRLIKSAAMLYLKQLRNGRNRVAANPKISKNALKAVDQKLSALEEKLTIGVFQEATPYSLLAADVVEASPQPAAAAPPAPVDLRPAPRVLDTIEITDGTLRTRCLDLFKQFRDSGQHERLDTVVTEATRIFEVRLREISGAAPELTGIDLANFAFGGNPPRIVLSSIDAEQKAAHLLFRGVFGFIRNDVHHKLVADLRPERVLQIVGMIDYLISLIEARTTAAAGATSS